MRFAREKSDFVKMKNKLKINQPRKVCYYIKTYTRLWKVNHDGIEEWTNQNKKLLTDHDMVALVSHVGDDCLDVRERERERRGGGGWVSLQCVTLLVWRLWRLHLHMVNTEWSAIDELLFKTQAWASCKGKGRCSARNTHHSFLKELNFHLQIYIMLNSLSGCMTFLIDAIKYSLYNKKLNYTLTWYLSLSFSFSLPYYLTVLQCNWGQITETLLYTHSLTQPAHNIPVH